MAFFRQNYYYCINDDLKSISYKLCLIFYCFYTHSGFWKIHPSFLLWDLIEEVFSVCASLPAAPEDRGSVSAPLLHVLLFCYCVMASEG